MGLEAFHKQQYLNIETFRKTGEGVKTPVWFVQEGETLYIWTEVASGKAKRVRRNPQVNIVPCKAAGEPLGEWMPARAVVVESPEDLAEMEKRMRRKYGAMFQMFRTMGQLRKGKYAVLRVTPAG